MPRLKHLVNVGDTAANPGGTTSMVSPKPSRASNMPRNVGYNTKLADVYF